MSVRATIRITTFAYAAALPVIYTMWIINVLPQVLVHNFGFDKKEIATGVSYYFSSYYYGIIVGCFLWPAIGKFFYKRTSLLFGLCITAVLNYLMGISSSFLMVCVYRFLCGTMHNLNSVGKDFIYEFAHTPMHRQYGFSAKSAFNVASLFAGPYLGFLLYTSMDRSFERVCTIISILYLVGIIAFGLVFFLDYNVKHEIDLDRSHHDLEEKQPLTEKPAVEEHSSMWHITRTYLADKYLRGLIVTYILNNGINKTTVIFMVMISTFAWADGGLGISTRTFSIISLLSFFPSMVVLMTAPLLVPKRFHYYTFIKVMVALTCVSLLLTPAFHELYTETTVKNFFVYFIISLIFWINPKQFSPFINVLVSNETRKTDRTAMNSLLFLSEIGAAAIIINLMAPVWKFSFYSPFMTKYEPYNHYFPFIVLVVGLSSSFFLLRQSDYFAKMQSHHDKKKKKHEAAQGDVEKKPITAS